MAKLWGDQRKLSTWWQLWVNLAEAEAELGLPILQDQITELQSHVDDVDFAAHCPHGRPVVTRILWDELERKVGRR